MKYIECDSVTTGFSICKDPIMRYVLAVEDALELYFCEKVASYSTQSSFYGHVEEHSNNAMEKYGYDVIDVLQEKSHCFVAVKIEKEDPYSVIGSCDQKRDIIEGTTTREQFLITCSDDNSKGYSCAIRVKSECDRFKSNEELNRIRSVEIEYIESINTIIGKENHSDI